ncbi:hypothetical protein J6590_018035 [Homalodisca vitripennis]|nr:hypothetical protein J6590_018035 [Homalodisca vitripennis]
MFSGSYLSSFLQNTLKSNQVEINTDTRTLRPIAKLREPRELFLQNTLKSNQVEINIDSRTLRPIAKLREPREL